MKKNYLYYSLSSAIPAALGFIIAIFLSRNITTVDYGYLGVFAMSLYVIEPLLFFFNLGLLEIKYVNLESNSYNKYRLKYINFGLRNFLVIFSFCLVASFIFSNYRFIFLAIPFIALTRFLIKIIWMELVQDKNAKQYLIAFLTMTIFIFLLTVIFVKYIDLSWEGRVLALFIPELMIVLFYYKNWRFNFNWYTKKEMLSVMKFGAPLFISLGAAWMLQEADKYIVLQFFSLSSLGVYTFAYLIGKIMKLINQPVLQILKPIYYNELKSSSLTKERHLRNVALFSVVVLCASSLLSYFLVFFQELIPDSYKEGIGITQIILFSFACFGIYQVSSIILEYYKLNVLKTKLLYIGAIINIFFSIILIDRFGILAPAYGTLIGFGVIAILSLFYGLRQLK
tara:strand:- start:16 stop:1206 length:1191 start_codon:yes stop_codon:yes gene_type:complete